MRQCAPLAALLLAAAVLAGCETGAGAPAEALPPLALGVSWVGTPACSRQSPPIRIARVPPATMELEVRLVDLDAPGFDHGGGRVQWRAGRAEIARGALTGYRGPCPPEGQKHTYEFVVTALDAGEKAVARGRVRVPFPP